LDMVVFPGQKPCQNPTGRPSCGVRGEQGNEKRNPTESKEEHHSGRFNAKEINGSKSGQ